MLLSKAVLSYKGSLKQSQYKGVIIFSLRTLSLEKYYTNEQTVKACLSVVSKTLKKYDYVVEPSAGAGAFFKEITHSNKIGIDIEPEDSSIVKYDWFHFKISPRYKKVLVIGNPPFGKYHCLSDAFLKQAFSYNNVQTVAFILPNTYHKHSRQKIIPSNWRIKHILELGKNCFIFNGMEKHIPCSFFVFDKSKGKDLRFDPNTAKTDDFIFSKPPHFDFFIFGASPSKIIKDVQPNNRGYFIKSKINKTTLKERFKNIKWKGNSCANGGVAWFTKAEIVHQYNQAVIL